MILFIEISIVFADQIQPEIRCLFRSLFLQVIKYLYLQFLNLFANEWKSKFAFSKLKWNFIYSQKRRYLIWPVLRDDYNVLLHCSGIKKDRKQYYRNNGLFLCTTIHYSICSLIWNFKKRRRVLDAINA